MKKGGVRPRLPESCLVAGKTIDQPTPAEVTASCSAQHSLQRPCKHPPHEVAIGIRLEGPVQPAGQARAAAAESQRRHAPSAAQEEQAGQEAEDEPPEHRRPDDGLQIKGVAGGWHPNDLSERG